MKNEAILFTAVAISILAFAVYVGGYFVLSETSTAYRFEDTRRIRWFESEWLVWMYEPVAQAEAYLTGWDVIIRQTSDTKSLSK